MFILTLSELSHSSYLLAYLVQAKVVLCANWHLSHAPNTYKMKRELLLATIA